MWNDRTMTCDGNAAFNTSSMTEDSHNLSWEDDDESRTSLATEIASSSRHLHRRTTYATAIVSFCDVAQFTGRYRTLQRELSRFNRSITLYHTTTTLPSARFTPSLHQATGNTSYNRHVTATRVDRSIRKGRPHLERRFTRIWSNLVCRIKT